MNINSEFQFTENDLILLSVIKKYGQQLEVIIDRHYDEGIRSMALEAHGLKKEKDYHEDISFDAIAHHKKACMEIREALQNVI